MAGHNRIDGSDLVQRLYFSSHDRRRKTPATDLRAIGISALAATVQELAAGGIANDARIHARSAAQTLTTDIMNYLEKHADLNDEKRHQMELIVHTLEGLANGTVELPLSSDCQRILDDMSQQALARANIRAFY
jgi:hypothetical protein